jgi:xanthine dehydrogenase small subunit
MNTRPIRFFHRGALTEVAAAAGTPPTRTVLEWLREDQRCTGTKEGCAEGDCGACTVVIGALDDAGALKLEPVNACIRFLPTLDGKALFTVEDLAGLAGPRALLHPVQQAMVDCHGSQCGFCTPGFVMSLWACYERHQGAATRPSRQQLADDLSGNLCRCTGYRPILDAGERMFGAPPARLDPAPVVAALKTLASDPPLHTASGFHAPRTVADLATLRAARPEARLVAGATDVGLWVTKQLRLLPELIYTGEVAALRRVEVDGGLLRIGAAASLEAAWSALAAHWPALRDMWLRFASPPVRHAGTMGGNVANGSPIGDSAPVLIALGARLVLRQGERVRRLPLEAFYLDYMKNALQAGEFVEAIEVPLSAADAADPAATGMTTALRAYKISKRFDSDISAVSAGLWLQRDGDVVQDVRLAFGGMAAIVKRAAAAEAALRGRPWDEAALQAAQAALAADFKPLTDMRASAAYRLQVAQNLLRRFWLETRAEAPLAEAQVSVFARAGGAAGATV